MTHFQLKKKELTGSFYKAIHDELAKPRPRKAGRCEVLNKKQYSSMSGKDPFDLLEEKVPGVRASVCTSSLLLALVAFTTAAVGSRLSVRKIYK